MIPIPARPTAGAAARHLDAARAALREGRTIVVFAEKGPPSPRARTRTIAPGAAWLALAGGAPLVPVALAGFLETGLGTRFHVRVLPAIDAATGTPAGGAAGPPDRAHLAHDGRVLTDALVRALTPAVAELETASLRENGRRPLSGLRRLFR